MPEPVDPSDPNAAAKALLEASPDSLEELFSRDPFEFTKQDIEKVVVGLRLQRERWQKAQGEGKKAPAKLPKAKVAPTLEDLGLV